MAPRLAMLLSFVGCVLALAGCGGGGPPRSHVTGKVTYKNAPVVEGHITFIPDPDKNKGGAQGSAPIKDGAYDTRQGKAPSPGAVIVHIDGFDGKSNPDQPAGNPIFFHKETIEVPAQESTKDFVVPDNAPKTQPPPKTAPMIVP